MGDDGDDGALWSQERAHEGNEHNYYNKRPGQGS